MTRRATVGAPGPTSKGVGLVTSTNDVGQVLERPMRDLT